MKVRSCFSTNLDPYRAGVEIARKLIKVHPEVIFLFPSIHYEGSLELTEAIYDVLESDQTVLIGSTGDGFYELHKAASVGVSALGINTGGAVKWHVASESDVGAEPFEATKRCMTRLADKCGSSTPLFYYLATDFRTNPNDIIRALQENSSGPIVGGAAADDFAMKQCFIYVNRRILTDSIAIMAIDGKIAYDIQVAQNLQPIGKAGIITKCDGAVIQDVDNISAMSFIERELGKPLNIVDEGSITFRLMTSKNDRNYQIRSLHLSDNIIENPSVKLFGKNRATRGDYVQVCLAPARSILQDVKNIGNSVNACAFNPIAALIISCAGRKKIMADNIELELQEIVDNCNSIKALAGFSSFGEFGPNRNEKGYSHSHFQNMTFVLLTFGEVPK
ncbi:FIST C-terminal domain-containing protein [bacterium]|nr:FIST C-terminal domain-containing protein [bacterium]